MGPSDARPADAGRTPPASRTAPRVAVVGAGPAGLMAAEVLARGGAAVELFDRMPTPGRKFLMAGRGGLNITHGEPIASFLARYGTGRALVEPALEAFDPPALRRWCADLGEDTIVGSSGRVFPRSFKASPLLRGWLRRLAADGVAFRARHRWTGWTGDGGLRFETPDGERAAEADAVVLALGGASWPQLGSDGRWADLLAADGVAVSRLRPANCGFAVAWSSVFRERFEGEPLKGVAFSHGACRSRGEATVTREGIEGGGIYALGASLREAVEAQGSALLRVDLRPDRDLDEVTARLAAARRGKASASTALRKALNLPPVAMGLLHEVAHAENRSLGARGDPDLAALVKGVPLRLDAAMPIAGAISTAGGIAAAELDARLMLRRRPGTFAAGEMLDWEAPTGGYLLQACFATGRAAGLGALSWLGAPPG